MTTLKTALDSLKTALDSLDQFERSDDPKPMTGVTVEELVKRSLQRFSRRNSDAVLRGIRKRASDDAVLAAAALRIIDTDLVDSSSRDDVELLDSLVKAAGVGERIHKFLGQTARRVRAWFDPPRLGPPEAAATPPRPPGPRVTIMHEPYPMSSPMPQPKPRVTIVRAPYTAPSPIPQPQPRPPLYTPPPQPSSSQRRGPYPVRSPGAAAPPPPGASNQMSAPGANARPSRFSGLPSFVLGAGTVGAPVLGSHIYDWFKNRDQQVIAKFLSNVNPRYILSDPNTLAALMQAGGTNLSPELMNVILAGLSHNRNSWLG